MQMLDISASASHSERSPPSI